MTMTYAQPTLLVGWAQPERQFTALTSLLYPIGGRILTIRIAGKIVAWVDALVDSGIGAMIEA